MNSKKKESTLDEYLEIFFNSLEVELTPDAKEGIELQYKGPKGIIFTNKQNKIYVMCRGLTMEVIPTKAGVLVRFNKVKPSRYNANSVIVKPEKK